MRPKGSILFHYKIIDQLHQALPRRRILLEMEIPRPPQSTNISMLRGPSGQSSAVTKQCWAGSRFFPFRLPMDWFVGMLNQAECDMKSITVAFPIDVILLLYIQIQLKWSSRELLNYYKFSIIDVHLCNPLLIIYAEWRRRNLQKNSPNGHLSLLRALIGI